MTNVTQHDTGFQPTDLDSTTQTLFIEGETCIRCGRELPERGFLCIECEAAFVVAKAAFEEWVSD